MLPTLLCGSPPVFTLASTIDSQLPFDPAARSWLLAGPNHQSRNDDTGRHVNLIRRHFRLISPHRCLDDRHRISWPEIYPRDSLYRTVVSRERVHASRWSIRVSLIDKIEQLPCSCFELQFQDHYKPI